MGLKSRQRLRETGGSLRLISAVLVLALILTIPTQAAPLLSREEDALPSGMNALENVESFAMARPGRFGDGPLMQAARADLQGRLTSMGYQVELHNYAGGTNILGVIPGTVRPNDWVVLSAHYDIAMTPSNGLGASSFGAWDDGSGVAALLEIARVAKERPWNNTLVIAFFDDEEAGLVGSGAFVSAYDGRMRNSTPIRLTANVNMDPPGMNWPCLDGSGIGMPVTFVQSAPQGRPGADRLRDLTLSAASAEGVPPEVIEFFRGGVTLAFVLVGSSDNANFGNRGIPDMYVGSSTHIFAGARRVDTTYPLHTPADNLASMIAWCGGDISRLAQSMEVEMRIVWRILLGIDGHGGSFPRP